MIYEVVLYGAGIRCRQLCKILKETEIKITAVVDSNPDKWGDRVEGYVIESPEKIKGHLGEWICITVADIKAIKAIRESLRQRHLFDLEKVIHYNKLLLEAYRRCPTIKQEIQENRQMDSQKENILFDCYHGLVLGGVEAWTMDLCGALIQNGKESTYIISDTGSYDVPACLKDHVLPVDINHQEPFSMTSIKNLVKTILEKLPCKVITCTTNEIMLSSYLIKLFYPDKIRILSVIHNSNENIYEDYMDFRECPDFYIGVSQDIKKNMIERGIRADEIDSMTCPFACDPVLARRYADKRQNPIRIGYAGRLEYEQKRMDLMLKLLGVLAERNICFQMEIAGEGTAKEDMEEFVRQFQLEDRVRFLGRLDRKKISSFWRQQDICVNIADYEGRSITIIEAMGNGSVPVVTATSGVRDDIIDDVNGYIVPLEDYYAIADKIQYLERNRERLSDMGKMAHDVVYPKSLMEPHVEFWKKVLSVQ